MIPDGAATPVSDGCPDCGAHGHCDCPGWVAVEDMAFGDLKGLLAEDNLSIGTP